MVFHNSVPPTHLGSTASLAPGTRGPDFPALPWGESPVTLHKPVWSAGTEGVQTGHCLCPAGFGQCCGEAGGGSVSGSWGRSRPCSWW